MSFSADEREMFQEAVEKHFGSLKAQGFQLSRVTDKVEPLTGEHLIIEVGVPGVGRGVRIALVHSGDGARQALTAFMHKGGTGGFVVRTFAKRIGAPEPLIQQLSLSSHDGPLSDRVDRVLGAVRIVIDEHLIPALTGGEWPVVPVDWAGYK